VPCPTTPAIVDSIENEKNLPIMSMFSDGPVSSHPMHVPNFPLAGVMEKPVFFPTILIAAHFILRPGKQSDSWQIGRSRYTSLTLSSEERVNFRTLPVKTN
jgi:hypothetical protein